MKLFYFNKIINPLVGYLEQLQNFLKNENYGELATIVGRYYAMDRDKRWERIRVCFVVVFFNIFIIFGCL